MNICHKKLSNAHEFMRRTDCSFCRIILQIDTKLNWITVSSADHPRTIRGLSRRLVQFEISTIGESLGVRK